MPTDQAPIESFLGHSKTEAPQLAAIEQPAALARELEAIRRDYNGVRLHAGIGYVTPTTSTQVAAQRSARHAATASRAPAGGGSPTIGSTTGNHPHDPRTTLLDRRPDFGH